MIKITKCLVLFLLAGVPVLPVFSNAQVIRFNHKLSQAKLNDAGFSLNRISGMTELHANSPLPDKSAITLIPFFGDTIFSNVDLEIEGNDTFTISISQNPGATNQPVPGASPLTVSAGCLFRIAANTKIWTSASNGGSIYVHSGRPVRLSISYRAMVHSPSPQVTLASLRTSVCQLVSPTKGIITVSGNKIMFDPWQVTQFQPVPQGMLNPVDASTPVPLEIKDGRMSIYQPTKMLKVPYKHFTIGINSIPFRYRSRRVLHDSVVAHGTATTSFNLALNLGYTWGYSSITTRARNDYSFTLGVFTGPSTVQLTSSNVVNAPNFTAGNSTNAVLSYGINAIFARNGLGIMISVGADKALGSYGNKWIYDNIPWIGLGVAANFLN